MNSVSLGNTDKSWREQLTGRINRLLPRLVQYVGKETVAVKSELTSSIGFVKKHFSGKSLLSPKNFILAVSGMMKKNVMNPKVKRPNGGRIKTIEYITPNMAMFT